MEVKFHIFRNKKKNARNKSGNYGNKPLQWEWPQVSWKKSCDIEGANDYKLFGDHRRENSSWWASLTPTLHPETEKKKNFFIVFGDKLMAETADADIQRLTQGS